MDHIILANKVLGKGRKGVHGVQRHIFREPSFVRKLVGGDVKAVELSGSGKRASGFNQPDPVCLKTLALRL